MLEILDAAALLRWREWSLAALSAARSELNALNIFPVADADTGTNLYLTMSEPLIGQPFEATAAAASAIADAALRGAHGSSGAILSQLLRGVAETLEATAEPVRGRAVARALSRAAESAYVAVSRPVEGTILSVARAAALAAVTLDSDDVGAVVHAAAQAAREALLRTPEQLDVLAAAGVVDAGGRGLVVLLDVLEAVIADGDMPMPAVARSRARRRPVVTSSASAREVTYLLRTAPGDATEAVAGLRAALDLIGDAVVVSGAASLWNVHVHTERPDDAVAAGHAVGALERVAIKPLDEVVLQPYFADSARIPVIARLGDTVAVAVAGLLADAGGRLTLSTLDEPTPDEPTLGDEPAGHPAREDPPPAGTVIVLGNELAALYRRRHPHVGVVAAGSVVQAFAALAVHDPTHPLADDLVAMEAAASATRYARTTPTEAAQCLARLLTDDSEILTLVTGGRSLARSLSAAIRRERPNLNVDVLVATDLGDAVLVGVE